MSQFAGEYRMKHFTWITLHQLVSGVGELAYQNVVK